MNLHNRQFLLRWLLVVMTGAAGMVWLVTGPPLGWRRLQTPQFRQVGRKLRIELAAAPKSQWSGIYCATDGDAIRSLAIAPASGWLYESTGDGFESDCGSCAESRGVIELKAVFGGTELPRDLVVVRWGKRRYLVPPDELDDFRFAVETGREPRATWNGRFFLRLGDECITVFGSPVFPANITPP